MQSPPGTADSPEMSDIRERPHPTAPLNEGIGISGKDARDPEKLPGSHGVEVKRMVGEPGKFFEQLFPALIGRMLRHCIIDTAEGRAVCRNGILQGRTFLIRHPETGRCTPGRLPCHKHQTFTDREGSLSSHKEECCNDRETASRSHRERCRNDRGTASRSHRERCHNDRETAPHSHRER